VIGWPLIGRQHFLPRRGEFQMYVRLVDAIELTQCWRGKRTATFCRQFPVVRQQLIAVAPWSWHQQWIAAYPRGTYACFSVLIFAFVFGLGGDERKAWR